MRLIFLCFLILAQIIKAELIFFFLGQMALNNYIKKLTNPVPLLKHLGVEIGEDTTIWPGFTINSGYGRNDYKHLKIGNHVRILWDVIIDLNDEVIIEDYVHIGAKSCLITHLHLGKTPLGISEYPYQKGRIIVKKGSVVLWNSIVLHDTIVNEHTMISAGSLISGVIPSFCVFGGNPARPMKKIVPKNPEDFK